MALTLSPYKCYLSSVKCSGYSQAWSHVTDDVQTDHNYTPHHIVRVGHTV